MSAQPSNQPHTANPLLEGQPNQAAGLLARYDFIIVGAGSAGCVVARRLLDNTDASVLVLEAGGANTDAASISTPCNGSRTLILPWIMGTQ